MNNKLVREIYETFQEWKGSPKEYRHHLENYVDMIISEKPQNQHNNYYSYWEGLKETKQLDESVWRELVEDIFNQGGR